MIPTQSWLRLTMVLLLSGCAALEAAVPRSLHVVLEAAANALGEDHEYTLLRSDEARLRAYRETVSLMLQSLAQDTTSIEDIVRAARFSLEDDTQQVGDALLIEARVTGPAKHEAFLAAGEKAMHTFALGHQQTSGRPLRDILLAPEGLTAPAAPLPGSSDELAAQASSVLSGTSAAAQGPALSSAALEDMAAQLLAGSDAP